MGHELSPRGIDLSDTYSHGDLPRLKVSLRKKALVYLYWNGNPDPVQWYREIMELTTPDVVVVAVVSLKPDDQAEETCQRPQPIAEEYARRMNWDRA